MILVQAIAQFQHRRDNTCGSHITRRALRRRLPRFLPALDATGIKEITTSIDKRTPEIVEDERSWMNDIPTRGQLEWAASVLATYQAIRPHVDSDDEAIDFIADALLADFGSLFRRFLARRLPRSIMKNRNRAGVAMNAFLEQYGTPWHWRGKNRPDGGVNVIATRCFYHGFMTAHGEPGLTRVFCHLDTMWTDRLLENSGGITLKADEMASFAKGDDHCCFPLVPLGISAASK